MKGIVLELKDISDSREVMESKETPGISQDKRMKLFPEWFKENTFFYISNIIARYFWGLVFII